MLHIICIEGLHINVRVGSLVFSLHIRVRTSVQASDTLESNNKTIMLKFWNAFPEKHGHFQPHLIDCQIVCHTNTILLFQSDLTKN